MTPEVICPAITGSDAVADRDTDPDTVAPAEGEVTETTGGVTSGDGGIICVVIPSAPDWAELFPAASCAETV